MDSELLIAHAHRNNSSMVDTLNYLPQDSLVHAINDIPATEAYFAKRTHPRRGNFSQYRKIETILDLRGQGQVKPLFFEYKRSSMHPYIFSDSDFFIPELYILTGEWEDISQLSLQIGSVETILYQDKDTTHLQAAFTKDQVSDIIRPFKKLYVRGFRPL